MVILPKAILKFNTIFITNFYRLLKNNDVLHMWKKAKIAIKNLYNKITTGGVTISDLKLYYRTIVIKTAWYWQKKMTTEINLKS